MEAFGLPPSVPNFTKRLLCTNNSCRMCLASVDEREADKSFYVLDCCEVFNWEIKAKYRDIKVNAENVWPVVCSKCKREFGLFNKKTITFFDFRIKTIVASNEVRSYGVVKRDVSTQHDINPQLITYLSSSCIYSRMLNFTIPYNRQLAELETFGHQFVLNYPDHTVQIFNKTIHTDICSVEHSEPFMSPSNESPTVKKSPVQESITNYTIITNKQINNNTNEYDVQVDVDTCDDLIGVAGPSKKK